MEKTQNQFAVITGASQGLGKAYAEELASRKINVILVSLPRQNVDNFAKEISKKYSIVAHHYEADFSNDDEILTLALWINAKFNVFMLINNAGMGGTKAINDASVEYINSIIQVNVKATAFLTHQLLPNLRKQDKSYILNVSSIAAFSPVGYKTVYPATKAFVHHFSRCLYAELKNTNVFVSVINPGAMATNPDTIARINKQGFLGKFSLLQPKKVAKYSIDRLYKRDTVILVNPVTWLIAAILPIWIKLPMMTNIIKREIQNA